MMIAAKSLNLTAKDIKAKLGESVSVGGKTIRTDDNAQMYTYFYKDRDGRPAFPVDSFYDVFTGKVPLEQAILPAPGGFSVLLAGSGMVEYSRLTPEVRDQLQTVVENVAPRYDRVLLDTGAGISDVVLYAVSLAHDVMVVATPEPTSLTDAYATIKVLATQQRRTHIKLLVNQVSRAGEGRVIRGQLQQVVDRYVSSALPEPLKLEFVGDPACHLYDERH